MFETMLDHLRFASSVVWGRPFHQPSLDRLIDAMLATQHEFGSVGSEAGELLDAPVLDETTRSAVQLRRFRAQSNRAVHQTSYYGQLFAHLALDPLHLQPEDIAHIPLTTKEALCADPDAFVCCTARPTFRTTTTGTTHQPATIYFSTDEMRTFIALSALSLLLQHQISPEDIVQINSSSRATLGNTCFTGACTRLGAMVHPVGLVEPEHTLALLAEKRHIVGKKTHTSVMVTYPSYLGELVERGLALGYRPADFGLERIEVGGEIVTEGLKRRCQALFGPVQFDEGYGVTEPWPFGATLCEAGHLHFEIAHGLMEVLQLEAAATAQPGEPGRLVLTPFPPYRQTTLLLRYDTQDVVRPLSGPLHCTRRHLPATSNLLGKLRLAVRHEDGWTFPRQLLEALETIEAVPLPARCGFWAIPGGVAVEVVTRSDTETVRRQIEQCLAEQAVPLQALYLREDRSQLQRPLPLRGDLRELSFAPVSTQPCWQPALVF